MTWIDNIIKHSIHYQQNFSKVWTYNSSSLTAQNFKGKKYLMFYVQLLIIANVQSPTSNLLDHFIFLRTPSSQAWQWSTEAASTSFYLVQHQVKKEIIRSLAKKMGSTQGYLGQPWISPEPSHTVSCANCIPARYLEDLCGTQTIPQTLECILSS